MIESENILRILKETQQAINENNPSKLKNLSDQTIHKSSTNQDNDNISIAVTVYSLGKIFERQDYRSLKGWDDFKRLLDSNLKRSIKHLEKNDIEGFRKHFELIGKAINKISGKLKKYIQEVFEKAKVNKASRIHEHGVSLGKTAKLLGVTVYDLANYTGSTGIADNSLSETEKVKRRIKIAEEILG
ncbi:MAG: hypothetical protein KC516_04160 [Nanoarchaeota archaeon]|nr:hypothetical protein [Nanoarchaeota archaeon]